MMNEELVKCTGLCRSFEAVQALRGVDLSLTSGKIVGLLGPNGSGKTTLIKILNGLLQPTAGEARVAGLLPGVETKAITSYLPDRGYFPDWMRVGDMIDMFSDFYADFDRTKAEEMCRVLGLEAGRRIKTLSKGTREKMQLMLVMSRRARLYLLDEPIAGVDPAAREFILRTILTNYNENGTVLISTHLILDVEQVLDEVMAQIDSNVVAFPCGIVDSEILYHSTKPIKCLDDIKGLKIRGVSDWANIETRLGASVVTMDGGDCYEALSHGTIDAAEYSSPSANWAAGFQEVAPYLTVPGVHQSCSVYLFLINRNIWDGLDAQTQSIIKLACTSMMAQNWAEDRAANGKAWEQFRALEAQGKLTIYRMPDEDLDKIQEVAQEYYEEKCAANPLFEKIYRSQQAYIASVSDWSEAATAK